MPKKLIILVVTLLLLALVVPTAYAAITDQQKAKLLSLHEEMIGIRKQMIDIYVSTGQITADQAKLMKENLDQIQKDAEKNGTVPGGAIGGCGGAGVMGNGYGNGMMGNGNGYGNGMMGRGLRNNL